jgi:hypothetical protein
MRRESHKLVELDAMLRLRKAAEFLEARSVALRIYAEHVAAARAWCDKPRPWLEKGGAK